MWTLIETLKLEEESCAWILPVVVTDGTNQALRELSFHFSIYKEEPDEKILTLETNNLLARLNEASQSTELPEIVLLKAEMAKKDIEIVALKAEIATIKAAPKEEPIEEPIEGIKP